MVKCILTFLLIYYNKKTEVITLRFTKLFILFFFRNAMQIQYVLQKYLHQ